MKARKQRSFSPDSIQTRMSQAIKRDFHTSLQEYEYLEGSVRMLRSRQELEIDKKYNSFDQKDESPRLLAFIKFLNVNNHMAYYTAEDLDLPDMSQVVPQSRYTLRANLLLRARAIMRSILTPFVEDEWFQYCKHGTGTSIGVSFKDTSLEAKSSFPITVTCRARPIFARYLDFDAMLKSAMVTHNQATPTGVWYKEVQASRATTVAKNDLIDRMIAVEPTGNMFLQQGLMAMMYSRMKDYGLDVATLPTEHKLRAQRASITANEATIDWSSASDCVSSDLLRWLIPPMWFECLDMVRSPNILIEDEMVHLNMFSTMGNAGTFPLETLLFYSFAMAVHLEYKNTLSCFPEWDERKVCSVFGDDCIVPTDYADLFIGVMESVGFICNKKKTFTGNEGFRESCGGDYLHGYDVRPFNLKGPTNNRLSSLEPWLYIVANRIIPKYIVCFGTRDYVYRMGFMSTLVAIFEEYGLKLKLVPPHYPDDSGLKLNSDIQRFIRCYPFELSRVGVDLHGSYTFRYLRFQYKQDVLRVEELHYATWIKCPGGERGPYHFVRRIGGYVVAKGRSGHWSLPSVYN